jgi:hypothetical protein
MSLFIRFMLAGVVIITSFVNFISCGAQNYKASLADDHQEQPEEQSASSGDPSSDEFGLHAPSGWVSIPITYSVEKNFTDDQLKGLQAAIATWETATGKKLFAYQGKSKDTGATFPDLFTSLGDSLNGMYDDNNWKKNSKSNNVLATTIWNNQGSNYKVITTSDIHYNTELYFIANALTSKPIDRREIVDMQSLALHEVGHLLGLAHVDSSQDSSSIMNPALYIGEGLATRALSLGDVSRIQKIYGCEGTACDKESTVQSIMASSRKTQSAKNANTAH